MKALQTSGNVLARRALLSRKAAPDPESPYAVEYRVKTVDVAAQGSALVQDLVAYDGLAYRKTTADSDGDGLTDDVELALGTSPVLWDSDFDNLGDAAEVALGSDPANPDTDGDTMPDGWEQSYTNCALSALINNAGADAEGDGLPNEMEYVHGTSPCNSDSDGDGMQDGYEVTHNFDPLNALDAAADADNDGLTNLQERQRGTDPNRSDTDGDGMPDGWEVTYNLNPLAPADGSFDSDSDGLPNVDEYANQTNPRDADTDDDTLPDGWEVEKGLNPRQPLGDDGAAGDPDGDGVPNSQERTLGTHPKVADTDHDGLNDGQEVTLTTDPLNWDTDGDGFSDGVEVSAGTDPKNYLDHPASGFSAKTQFTAIQRTNNTATVVYTATDLIGTSVVLDIQENDDLTNGAGWAPTGVQRIITEAGTYTNLVPDPDADGILNLRIESK